MNDSFGRLGDFMALLAQYNTSIYTVSMLCSGKKWGHIRNSISAPKVGGVAKLLFPALMGLHRKEAVLFLKESKR